MYLPSPEDVAYRLEALEEEHEAKTDWFIDRMNELEARLESIESRMIIPKPRSK